MGLSVETVGEYTETSNSQPAIDAGLAALRNLLGKIRALHPAQKDKHGTRNAPKNLGHTMPPRRSPKVEPIFAPIFGANFCLQLAWGPGVRKNWIQKLAQILGSKSAQISDSNSDSISDSFFGRIFGLIFGLTFGLNFGCIFRASGNPNSCVFAPISCITPCTPPPLPMPLPRRPLPPPVLGSCDHFPESALSPGFHHTPGVSSSPSASRGRAPPSQLGLLLGGEDTRDWELTLRLVSLLLH